MPGAGVINRARPRPALPAVVALLVAALTAATLAAAVLPARAAVGLPPSPAVLEPAAVAGSAAPAPSPEGLRIALDPIVTAPDLGGSVGAVVIDPATGSVVYDSAGGAPLVPASTAKLLTAVGVLSALGTTRRLATTVVAGSEPGTVVLVGGGDPTLTVRADAATSRPSLEALAETVVGTVDGQVRVAYDASLFGPPSRAPGWGQGMVDGGFVAPVSALTVDQGRVTPDSDQRVVDPARSAAETFAALLRERGIEVVSVEPGTAPANATVLAAVESGPIAELVTTMLADSDNDAAEMLAHVAGAEVTGVGTFASATEATLAGLTQMRVPTTGIRLDDASGLSSRNAVPARALAAVLAAVAGSTGPDFTWPIGPGLAVAGFTGTLADRFVSMPTAVGIVRAKTGTLDGVSALAGTLRDLDGRVLVFAVIANEVPDVYAARAALDSFATTLVGCGCE